MKLQYIAPILLLVVTGVLLYPRFFPAEPDGYRALRAAKAHAELTAHPEVRILDIRTPAEFADGHIKGAVNIDFYARTFEQELDRLDRNVTYFVYCRSGNRSSQALGLLKRLGFEHIWHLADGVVGWEKAGLPLVRQTGSLPGRWLPAGPKPRTVW